jgi:hypothetical protein
MFDVISDYHSIVGKVCILFQWFIVGFFAMEMMSSYCLSLEYDDVPTWIYTGALCVFGFFWILKVLAVRIWGLWKLDTGFAEIVGHSLVNALALFMVDIHGQPIRFWKMKRLGSASDDGNQEFFSVGEWSDEMEVESEEESELDGIR